MDVSGVLIKALGAQMQSNDGLMRLTSERNASPAHAPTRPTSNNAESMTRLSCLRAAVAPVNQLLTIRAWACPIIQCCKQHSKGYKVVRNWQQKRQLSVKWQSRAALARHHFFRWGGTGMHTSHRSTILHQRYAGS